MASISNSDTSALRRHTFLFSSFNTDVDMQKKMYRTYSSWLISAISLQTASPDSKTCNGLSSIGRAILALRFKLQSRCFAQFSAPRSEVWAPEYGVILPRSNSAQLVFNLDQFFQSYRGKTKKESPSNYSPFSFPNRSQHINWHYSGKYALAALQFPVCFANVCKCKS